MTRRAILIVSSIPAQLGAWRTAVRRAGCLSLEASTVERARALLQKIRPSLILISAALAADGASLVTSVAEDPGLSAVAILVLGAPDQLDPFGQRSEPRVRAAGAEAADGRAEGGASPDPVMVRQEPDADELVMLLREALTPAAAALPAGNWSV